MGRAVLLLRLGAGCAVLLAGCAGARPVPAAPIPPPPPSALAVLSLRAGELGLSGEDRERLEIAERALAAATVEARREVEETLTAGARRSERGRSAGAGAERDDWEGRGPSGAPGGPGLPGGMGGGRHGGGGGFGGGHGGQATGGPPGPGRHVASLLRRIEDAEMKAYLEAEAWLPERLHERCREVVSRQREQLLGRDDAIRRRLGLAE